jgi:hypothetical protein
MEKPVEIISRGERRRRWSQPRPAELGRYSQDLINAATNRDGCSAC